MLYSAHQLVANFARLPFGGGLIVVFSAENSCLLRLETTLMRTNQNSKVADYETNAKS